MKKKISVPTDRIAVYVRELKAAGFRTTSDLDADQVRQWMGSLDLEKPPFMYGVGRRVLVGFSALAVLGLGLGGLLLLRKGKNVPVPLIPMSGTASTESPLRQNPTRFQKETEPKEGAGEKLEGVVPSEKSEAVRTDSERVSSNPEIEDTPSNGPATLSIQTVPPFAEVVLDGVAMGRTPLERVVCPAGEHRLVLKPKLGRPVDTILEVQPGAQALKFVLMDNPEEGGTQ
jgi:hypothetical protein